MTTHPTVATVPAVVSAGPEPEIRAVHDPASWNALVLRLPGYDLRQGFEWGQLRALDGWRPYRLAAVVNASPVVAMSALAKTIPGFRRPIVYVPRGPLMDFASESAWPALRAVLRRIDDLVHPAFVRVSPAVPDANLEVAARFAECGFSQLPDDWTIWNTPRIGLKLDVRPALDVLWRGLRKRYREYITSAPRRGVVVTRATGIDDLRRFHMDLAAHGRVKGFPVRKFDYFRRLWDTYASLGDGVLLLAHADGVVVGGLLGARLGAKATMLYSESLGDATAARAHHGPLLYWDFIRWAKDRQCDTLDWGGSGTHFPPRETDPGFGVYRFKMGFGSAIDRTQGYYDLVSSVTVHRAFRLLEARLLPFLWTLRARVNR
jgi:lipid II:glycine glycyltransferase (peptidoglycan interpeptide bridge formation enzyme)